ncbi:MAG: dihydrodipicolinate synthase family protein [Candidatus Promineifilaceae bacterium]
MVVKDKIAELRLQIQGGVTPAMATPLQEDGATPDLDGVTGLADFLIGSGVNGLFVGGTTGEGILLSKEARIKLLERALKVANGRVPVVAHAGTNTTTETLALARHAQKVGAAAVVVVTPFYYGMGDEALFYYFQTVASAVPEMPLLAYDIPHMAVNGISPALLGRMAAEIPSFAGVKCSRPDAQMVRALIDAGSAETMVLAGNERIAAGLLALGASGLISGFATAVPEPFVALTRAFRQGDLSEVRRLQRLINQVLDLIPSEVRIGAIKAVLNQRGIAVGSAVPPRAMPSESWRGWTNIKKLLDMAAIAA